jgi:glyoxylase-like metal-dependent hydrolase (beta-lactamase superfamily II)
MLRARDQAMKIAGEQQGQTHPTRDEDQDPPLQPATQHLHSSSDESDAWSVAILVRGTPTRGSSVLARRGAEIAVIDTGLAHHGAILLAALAAHRIEARDVTLVINTHAHVDHSHNNGLFPNARVFCSARDREWTRRLYRTIVADPPPALEDLLPYYPQLLDNGYSEKLIRKVLSIERSLWDESRWGALERTVWLEESTLPEGLTVVPTPGHTPDHVSLAICGTGGPVLVAGDALLRCDEASSTLSMIPPWSAAAYAASRERVLGFRGVVVPGHDDPFRTTPASAD